MRILTLRELKSLVTSGPVLDTLFAHVQIDNITEKRTKNDKPFLEIHVADSGDRVLLRAWEDAQVYKRCKELLERGHCVEVSGEFGHHAQFGLEARTWDFRHLHPHERAALMGGAKETRERQEADYQFIAETVQSLADPRLRILCEMFLVENGDRFRRTAGARSFHHARRGGLVEHTAQMMRSACALADVYKKLNRDLLVAGVLFHDTGKLWENHVPEEGFGIEHCERGELLGHINMGIEIVNNLWRQLRANDAFAEWKTVTPSAESVRLHLLHLIASHHGEMAFGSPVVPKTPEACALHYIDNLDAKMEMIFTGYATAAQVAPNIYDKVRPLGYLIEPLPLFPADAEPPGGRAASGHDAPGGPA